MKVVSATRERLRKSFVGALVVCATVPWLLTGWAEPWFVVCWTAGYVLGVAVFVALRLLSENPWIEFGWGIVFSLLFAAVPLSTIISDAAPRSVWIAVVIGVFHLANEIAVRDYVRVGDWRIGPLLVALATCSTVAYNDGVALGLGCFAASLLVIHSAYAVMTEAVGIRFERDHDELTGLLSRRGLLDRLSEADDGDVTVAMIDADHFKLVNDSYGYAVGDAFLTAIAKALRSRLGSTWTIARQGGDEFVAVAAGSATVDETLAASVTCEVPYRSSSITLDLALSVGVAHGHSRDLDLAMTQAGHALRASKRQGGGLSTFDSSLERRFMRALTVADPGHAGGQESLFAVAQPICRDSGLVGWELLARWRAADGEVLSPATVLPLLAENGLTPQLNDRMLEIGVRFAARFSGVDDAPYVSVNITASHLANPLLARYVADLLQRYRVEPRRLMIEITESEGLDAVATWRPMARALVDLGVKLAIDDFGSGYSSIERMHQLPVTHLKFDRSLVSSLGGPLGEVVRGVVSFAAASGIGIIAEGIETPQQRQAMERLGVTTFQGHLFGRPAPLDDAARDWTSARRARLAREARHRADAVSETTTATQRPEPAQKR